MTKSIYNAPEIMIVHFQLSTPLNNDTDLVGADEFDDIGLSS